MIFSPPGLTLFNLPLFRSWLVNYFNQIWRNMESPASKALVAKWMASPQVQVHMQDFIIPPGGYKNFNAFFGRELKPGVRPISGKGNGRVVVSPSDGITKLVVKSVSNHDRLKVKGDILNVREIFGNNPLAQKFIGGPVIKNVLFDTNYHRFHAPVTGKVLFAKAFDGLMTASKGWEKTTFKHRRGVYIFYNPCVGYVGMVPVGFWMVSSIHLFEKAGSYVKKGQEVGSFALGGSAILLFFEPGKVKVDMSEHEKPIQMGQPLVYAHLACTRK